jgi:hypothetical protein
VTSPRRDLRARPDRTRDRETRRPSLSFHNEANLNEAHHALRPVSSRSPRKRKRGRPPTRFRSFKQRNPQARLWVTVGLSPRCARALADAGLSSLVDLEGKTPADLAAIPGVGPSSRAILTELLDRPLLPGARVLPEDLWRRRGLRADAAVTFALTGITLERLKSMTRSDLLDLERVGPATLRACELLLGREIPPFRPPDSVAAFWRNQGIPPRVAKALSRAGLRSPEDLHTRTREDLLAQAGIGDSAVQQLEALAGCKIPSRSSYWLSRGLSPYVANALLRAGIRSVEDLLVLNRKQFLARPGLGKYVLAHCEKRLGLTLP